MGSGGVGVGRGVGLAVGVGVGVAVGVGTGVGVDVGTGVGVGTRVGVGTGVAVGIGVGMLVGVGTTVGVLVGGGVGGIVGEGEGEGFAPPQVTDTSMTTVSNATSEKIARGRLALIVPSRRVLLARLYPLDWGGKVLEYTTLSYFELYGVER